MRIITSIIDAKALIGEEVGLSDWVVIDQHRIDQFAEATADHQWIHVDTERAMRESVYTYERFKGDVARAKNRIKSIWLSQGIQCVGQKIYEPEHQPLWLDQLTAPLITAFSTVCTASDSGSESVKVNTTATFTSEIACARRRASFMKVPT